MYKERAYRRWVKSSDLVSFGVAEAQTDLFISADRDLKDAAREAALNYRRDIETYIKKDKRFFFSLEPIKAKEGASPIVRAMVEASRRAGVGPMAAVAGAIAEFVGRDLLKLSKQVIVENGGDIFIRSSKARVIGVWAGDKSPYSGKLALEIAPSASGIGVCTSSGTVSHSLSFGNADVSLIISKDTALADAVATAAGNMVKTPNNVEKAINFARSIDGVKGVLITIGDRLGSWGEIKLV